MDGNTTTTTHLIGIMIDMPPHSIPFEYWVQETLNDHTYPYYREEHLVRQLVFYAYARGAHMRWEREAVENAQRQRTLL